MGRRLPLVPLHLLALAVMCAPVAVVAYSTGATDESCYEMQVFHVDSFSGNPANAVDCGASCQFSLSLVSVMASETNQTIVGGNETVYQCGRVYELYLSSSQNPFEGYLVEARASAVSGDFDPTSTIWGEWIYNDSDPYHGVVCNRSSTDSSESGFFGAVTQNAAGENTNVTLYWRAPQPNTTDEFNALPDSLTFWVTVVEEQLTFFLPIKGPVLDRDCEGPLEPSPTPTPGEDDDSDSDLPIAVIGGAAGGGIAVIVVIILVVVVVCCCCGGKAKGRNYV